VAEERADKFLTTTLTSTYLLDGLRDPDNRTIWQQFVERYRPMIVKFACRLGLGREDAEDAAQQTLIVFNSAYQAGKYERDRGRLRQWLFGIARNQIKNALRQRPAREVQIADRTDQSGFFAGVPSDDQLTQLWEQQWQEAVLRQCLEEVRPQVEPKTMEAFELFARDGWPAQRVADHLGMTANAVFLAKHHVLKKIRAMLPAMEEAW